MLASLQFYLTKLVLGLPLTMLGNDPIEHTKTTNLRVCSGKAEEVVQR